MPRKYIRKCPERKVCTKEQIERATKLIKEGKSQRTAAGIVGTDESTLRKRMKLGFIATSMGRYKPTFTREQELEIYNYCKSSDDMFYGVTLDSLRRIVYEFAEVNKIENRFDKTTKTAGKDWVYEFMKRHPDLALRETTPTSIARAIGFNRIQVNRFYTNLNGQERYNFLPGRIFNMDETGISTVPKKTPKVISFKGKRNVNKIVSGERGQTITVVCCVSATGNYVPPAFIFPRKRMKSELMDGAPAGSVGMTSDSGFINTDLYLNWLQHFNDYVSPTANSPVLLIIDNHSSHISLQATLFCRSHNIIVITLPPHGSHKMQPLDKAIYSPLKNQYATESDRWMAQHPGRSINQYQVALIFDRAFKKIATVGDAASAFKATGIFPFNDDLFTEADFTPSSVTDIFSTTERTANSNPSSSGLTSFVSIRQDDEGLDTPNIAEVHIASASSSGGRQDIENDITVIVAEIHPQITSCPQTQNDSKPSSEITILVPELEPLNLGIELEREEIQKTQCSCSSISNKTSNTAVHHVPLLTISPLPKAKHIQTRRKNPSKSEIITSSPFKNKLEEKQKEIDHKASKIRKPKIKRMTMTKDTSNEMKSMKDTIIEQKKRISKPLENHNKKKYYCPLCHEEYKDPPTEEWIECNSCKLWWHEDCTSYENGIFTCDLCCQDD